MAHIPLEQFCADIVSLGENIASLTPATWRGSPAAGLAAEVAPELAVRPRVNSSTVEQAVSVSVIHRRVLCHGSQRELTLTLLC